MIFNQRSLLTLFMVAIFLVPAIIMARGNHCVAQKSPTKMAVDAGSYHDKTHPANEKDNMNG